MSIVVKQLFFCGFIFCIEGVATAAQRVALACLYHTSKREVGQQTWNRKDFSVVYCPSEKR